MLTFEHSSLLNTTPTVLKEHSSRIAGVNREMFPIARMTVPAEYASMDLSQAQPGKKLFRSWILFLGFIPIDYDDITFTDIFPDGGFQESSTMATNRIWKHRRAIVLEQSGTRLTDLIQYEPRIYLLGLLMFPIYRLTFALRHFNLKRIFKTSR
ncbi:MAG: hypothetical protein K8S54_09245 [Spirochaetia bacterium]|nr:hypothetical protein [Spirochaetia bacterium]